MKKLITILMCLTIIPLLVLVSIFIFYSGGDKYIISTLTKNSYIVDDIDKTTYNKITTSNTLDEYYEDIDNVVDSEYREYSLLLNDSIFMDSYMYNVNTTNNVINIKYDFVTDKITYDYDIINSSNNSSVTINGEFNNTNLTCNVKDGKLNDDLLNSYCESAKEEMINFLNEKSIFNDKFINIMKNRNN